MAVGDSSSSTTLQRPYLLRAMHEWMTDNDLTPHIVVDVSATDAALPVEHAKDGRLILNVSYSATENLLIGNESASFDARFSGVPRHLDIPILAIVGVYARETGQGMIFSSEQASESSSPEKAPAQAQPTESDGSDSDGPDSDGPEPDGEPPRGRPQLKVVK